MVARQQDATEAALAPNMALQRTRRPRFRSGRSLRSLGSPLNAYSLGGLNFHLIVSLIAVFLLPSPSPGIPIFRSRAEKGLVVAVVDHNGDALPGATVVVDLAPPSGSKPGLFQAVTDAQGEVALPDVPPGTYIVRACLNGLFVDFEAKTRVVEKRPAYVVLSMAIGEPLDSACPRPRMVEIPVSDATPFVPPPPLPKLPGGRRFPELR